MTLLRAAAGAPAPGFLPARFPLERANANRLGESYDKASPFPETKSRLRAACCKTSGRPATSPRQDRRSSRSSRFQIVAEDLLGRPRLAGDFPKTNKERLRQTATVDGEHPDRLLLCRTLQNHRVQILDPSRDLRASAQDFVQLLYFFVQRSSALEIQLLAGPFALLFESGSQ